jgi:hypothetical protein
VVRTSPTLGIRSVDRRPDLSAQPRREGDPARGGPHRRILPSVPESDEPRERAAASYSVNASIEALRGGTTVVALEGDVEAAQLPVAVRALRHFFEDPVATVFDDEHLGQARADAARSLNLTLSTTGALAMRVVSAWNIGRPIEEIDRYPEVVAAASREDMARLAEQCRANWVLGLMGDESRIRAGLEGWSP